MSEVFFPEKGDNICEPQEVDILDFQKNEKYWVFFLVSLLFSNLASQDRSISGTKNCYGAVLGNNIKIDFRYRPQKYMIPS